MPKFLLGVGNTPEFNKFTIEKCCFKVFNKNNWKSNCVSCILQTCFSFCLFIISPLGTVCTAHKRGCTVIQASVCKHVGGGWVLEDWCSSVRRVGGRLQNTRALRVSEQEAVVVYIPYIIRLRGRWWSVQLT